jgi:hypothetical protein
MAFPYNGIDAIAIGTLAGSASQQSSAVAVGYKAGQTQQGTQSVAIGFQAGNSNQGQNAVAIGTNAGSVGLGNNSISIGNNAGTTNQASGTIFLNASGVAVSPTTANAFYVRPVRGVASSTPVVVYNTVTSELTYNTSSIKYKKNVIDLTEDTSVIYKIRAREYDSKDENKHFLGYIAEELNECSTHFTWKNPDGSPEGIEWFNLLLFAIEELKKQRNQIQNLQERNKILEQFCRQQESSFNQYCFETDAKIQKIAGLLSQLISQ